MIVICPSLIIKICGVLLVCWYWMRWIHSTVRRKKSSTPCLNGRHSQSQNSCSLVSHSCTPVD